jgi:hypothetical protein
MREAGFNNLTVDELLRLRIHGINAEQIRKMKDK